MEKVYLHNPSSEEISLISISATTAHFHASFFQNRVSIGSPLNKDFVSTNLIIMPLDKLLPQNPILVKNTENLHCATALLFVALVT